MNVDETRMAATKLRREIIELVGWETVLPIDTCGHRNRFTAEPGFEQYVETFDGFKLSYSLEDPQGFLAAARAEGLPTRKRWRLRHEIGLPTGPEWIGVHGADCYYCAHDEYETDGVRVYASEPCRLQNGIKLSVDLEVPSGRLVFGNDFRPQFDLPPDMDDDRLHYVNMAYGIANTVKDLARLSKCVHLFVGNSMPGVYRQKDGSILLGTSGRRELETTHTFEHEGKTYELPDEEEVPVPGENLGAICTDLWWATFVDGDEFERRFNHKPGKWPERGGPYFEFATEVAVEPGTWTFEYYRLLRDFSDEDYSTPTIYAKAYRKK